MVKKAEIKVIKKGGHVLTVVCPIKNNGAIFDELKDAFADYVREGDRIDSIFFWEERDEKI